MSTLREDAAKLLSDGKVKLVIGYRRRGARRAAALCRRPDETADLVCDADCRQNLAAYLSKPEVRGLFPAAVAATPRTARSLVVLAAESQLEPGQVLALLTDEGGYRGVMDLAGLAKLLNERYAELPDDKKLTEQVRGLERKSSAERALFWTQALSACTRCHACRAACPGCYCKRCIVEKNLPQWVSTAARRHGNFAYHVVRAFHQAGRCTLCGACEAACPQGIPLMLLNAKLAEEAHKEFGSKPGYDPAAKPLVGSWDPKDDDKYMR